HIDKEVLKKQILSIDEHAFFLVTEKLLGRKLSKKELLTFLDEIEKYLQDLDIFGDIYDFIEQNSTIELYILLNIFFSLLIDADKLHAGVQLKDLKRVDIQNSSDLVINYVNSFQSDKKIDKIRKEIFNLIKSKVLNTESRVFTLNLPTGAGKTLMGFYLAFKLKDILKEKNGMNYRIIYCLPYLSITEQNYSVIKDVLQSNNIKTNESVLLKHHHLVHPSYEDYSIDQSEILIESWNSEIIVTTFYQLFHTLFSNRNSDLKKFHKLSRAIIVIDELQAINHKYFYLTKSFLQEFVGIVDSYIILLTATNPNIFDNEVQIVERDFLYSLRQQEVFNRYRIHNKAKDKLTIEEMLDVIKIEENKSYLFIMNTIKSAQKLYFLLKDKYSLRDSEITLLSTHIVPVERQNRIKEIKEGKYKIVVSTQLVEAGVDIDFDVVIRDMAGLDSIVQSAGRCNRNKRSNFGDVYVFCLYDNEAGYVYSSKIYDPVVLNTTYEILKDKDNIEEREIYELVEKYFEELLKRKSTTESQALLNAIYRLRYDGSSDNNIYISDFSLIEDSISASVFVEYDDNAIDVWNKFCEIYNLENFIERKKKMFEIKENFYKYVINVIYNKKNADVLKTYENINGIYVIRNENIRNGTLYDRKVGLLLHKTDNII
ncbi:MAG: CRISPR-associated helicase Cas3', partial [Candidatus Aenigmarchaeota archaeon]|nr:CRISPR-associated helicase Cas3' [Candidatus Aenigmarchaeota archaeon]MDW8149036.1 CRISPR-associated helicase Cas3' [Candidatus Aenigmarchaeota archaeon]